MLHSFSSYGCLSKHSKHKKLNHKDLDTVSQCPRVCVAQPLAVGEKFPLIPAGPCSPNLLCSVLPGVCLEPETGTKTRT